MRGTIRALSTVMAAAVLSVLPVPGIGTSAATAAVTLDHLRAGVIAAAGMPGNTGYWLLDAQGGIFTFGDARFYGSVPGLRARGHQIGQARLVGMATTPAGRGYWLLDEYGGMFAFGDARFYGSVPGLRAAGHAIGPARMVGMAATPTGRGYWLLDDQGGMFAFGDARFRGSVPGLRAAGHAIGPARLVGMAPTRSGRGYWLLDDHGGVFNFGDARFAGSLGTAGSPGRAVGLITDGSGGYRIATAEGPVRSFGSLPRVAGPVARTPVAAVAFAGPGTVGHAAAVAGLHTPAVLRTHAGDLTTSRDGQSIANLHVTGIIRVRHADVTITNVKTRAIDVQADRVPRASATIRWSTIGDPAGRDDGHNAVGKGNYRVYRSEIFGAVDLLKVTTGSIDVRESWIHGGYQWASDPGQNGGPAHVDFLQTTLKTDVSGITLLSNYFDAWVYRSPKRPQDVWRNLGASYSATGVISLFQHKNGRRVHDVLVKGNVFNGDAYSYFHATDNANGQPPANVRFLDNVIHRNYPTYGANKLAAFRTPSAIVWDGNVDQHGDAVVAKGTRRAR